MDCFNKKNSSPFDPSLIENCPGTADCPDPKLPDVSTHCFWDEAIFDCFNDMSSSHHTPNSAMSSGAFVTDDPAHIVDSAYFLNNRTTTTDFRSEAELDHEEGYGAHAALNYTDVEDAGPPTRPQEFPTPFVSEGVRGMLRAMDHRTHKVRDVRNVLMSATVAAEQADYDPYFFSVARPQSSLPGDQRAYLMKKKINKSKYGNVYLSVVLRRRMPSRNNSFDHENEKRPEDDFEGVEWESTDEFVAVTISTWNSAMRAHRTSLSRKREGIVHAIAAMQHVGCYHPHVKGLLDVFQDEEHLYTVTRFHGGVDLQTKVITNRETGQCFPNEPQCRTIFTQLLQGLFHMQRKGVCHSNLSLENIFVDPATIQNLVIEDLGRSMRVAYNDPSNYGCVLGETEGTTRRLLQLLPQDFQTHPTENMMYLAPEILENESSFDGFAADLWAAGCVLFVLLVGMAPFKTAHYWDAAYAEISAGNLKGLLASLHIQLSEEAVGLLQNMFWRDPRDRLTLAQIMEHPWVKNQITSKRRSSNSSGGIPRNISGSHLSSAGETSSTTSSFAGDAMKDRSSGSMSGSTRRSLSKALNSIFGSSPSKDKKAINKIPADTKRPKSPVSGWLTPTRRPSVSSNGSRRKSLGGLSSAASSATAGSPASGRNLSGADASSPICLQLLQLPQL